MQVAFNRRSQAIAAAFRSRPTAMTASFAVHGAILAALLFWWQRPKPRPPETRQLAVLSLSAMPNASDAPATPPKPVTLPPPRIVLPSTASVVALASPLTGAVGPTGCTIATDVQRALEAHPEAMTELNNIPVENRSVASAIVLWTGDPLAVRSPLPVVDAVIEQALETASPECLDLSIAGPDLIYLPQGDTTLTLAFGSGNWRWREFFSALKEKDEAKSGDPS